MFWLITQAGINSAACSLSALWTDPMHVPPNESGLLVHHNSSRACQRDMWDQTSRGCIPEE